jgi:hypothetical protein
MQTSIPRVVLEGKLPRKNISLQKALEHLSIFEDSYELPLASDPSPYLNRAIQGATIVPRAAWFVVPTSSGIVDTSQPYLETDKTVEKKKPWDKLALNGEVESEFLYGTSLGIDVVPFCAVHIRMVVLPLLVNDQKKTTLLNSEDALEQGFSALSSWLKKLEAEWESKKKKGTKLSLYENLNYQNKLTNQAPNLANRVIFNAAGTHITAAAVPGSALTAKFGKLKLNGYIVESKYYGVQTSTKEEAHYLAAILNSPSVDKAIKPYQTLGIYAGERDIHRRAFEVVPIPFFDSTNAIHQSISTLGQQAEEEVKKLLPYIKTTNIGKKRMEVRAGIASLLKDIDKATSELVLFPTVSHGAKKVSKGQTFLEYK